MKKSKTDVFKAIADPRRRKIIQLLLVSAFLPLNAIADNFDMSRQSITRHINTLESAGILKTKKRGRESIFYLNTKPLKEIYNWVEHYKIFWESKLDDLEILIKKKEH